MYNSYFGFTESPFENKLDQKFLFLGEDHGEVLAALMYFIQEKKGFAVVCGDVGTGKTMVINGLLDRLPEATQPIIIANPGVTYQELVRYIARELHLQTIRENILELTDDIKEALVVAGNQGRNYVLIVDEAHLLPDASLEDIRLLSNIETREQKLLQILLVGQYELSHKLDRPEMRQLRQRINISRFLSPLSAAETKQYVNYRLTKVGSDFEACFAPSCAGLIFKMTEGIPRRVNQLCDNALLICMTARRPKVDCGILKKAQEALLTDRLFTPPSLPGKMRRRPWRRPLMAVCCLAGLALAAVLGPQWAGGRAWRNLVALHPGTFATVAKVAAVSEPVQLPHQQIKPPAHIVAAASPRNPANPEDAVRPDAVGDVPAADWGPAGSPAPVPERAGETSQPAAIDRGGALPAAPRAALVTAGSAELQESGGTEDTSPAPQESAPPNFKKPPEVHQFVVKSGDYLSKIVGRRYPQNPDLGMEAVILANLKNSREDLIYPGQVLFLPEIDFGKRIIRLRDNLYYCPYGHFRSFADLQEAMSLLSRQKTRYLVINSINGRGGTTHRLIMGGYERCEDLEKNLRMLRKRDGVPRVAKSRIEEKGAR